MRRLRVAMLTYSLRPRGGVVHALEVSEALARRGHHVELFALGPPCERFFREPTVPSRIIRYQTIDAPFDERIIAMCAAYRDGLAEPLAEGRFDLIHSQDCLSANAAVELRDRGTIGHVIRTVHHLDDFTSPSLIECQNRSILGPDSLLCVSEPWVERLRREYDAGADVVRNGVDTRRYRPSQDASERRHDRATFDFGQHFTVLTIGGIEPRKGSLTLLDGFARLREVAPSSTPGWWWRAERRCSITATRSTVSTRGWRSWVSATPCACSARSPMERSNGSTAPPMSSPSRRRRRALGWPRSRPLASGLPVVASDLDSLTTFLEDDRSALLVPVGDHEALAGALARLARSPATRSQLRARGLRVAADYTWNRAAIEHERVYDGLLASLETVGARSV